MERPTDVRVKAGRIAAFRCVAAGDPTPVITWRRNGNRVTEGQSRLQIYDFPGGSVLRVEPARRNKRGEKVEFECVAENALGDPVTAKATLDVLEGKIENT